MIRHIFRSASLAVTRRPCIPSGVVCRGLFRAQLPRATTQGLQQALRSYSTKETQESEKVEDFEGLGEREHPKGQTPGITEAPSKKAPVSSSALAQLRRHFGLDTESASSKGIKDIEDPIFLAVDAEAWERNTSKVTEIGIAALDTRFLSRPTDRMEWIRSIDAHHFTIRGRAKYINKRFAPGCPEKFMFGTSETRPIKEMPGIFKKLFTAPDETKKTKGALRNFILVGHDLKEDIRYMKRLDYDVTSEKSVVLNMDTQTVAKELSLPLGLEKLVTALDIVPKYLHNAGNDAVYTMQAMVCMALYGHELSLPDITKETMAELKKKYQEQRAKILHARLVKAQNLALKRERDKLTKQINKTIDSEFESTVVEYSSPPEPTYQALERVISSGLAATYDCVTEMETSLELLQKTSALVNEQGTAGNVDIEAPAAESLIEIQKTLVNMRRAVELRKEKEEWIGTKTAKKEASLEKLEQQWQAAHKKARKASDIAQPLKRQMAARQLPQGVTELDVRNAIQHAAQRRAEADVLSKTLHDKKKEWKLERAERERLYRKKLREATKEGGEEEEREGREEDWTTAALKAKAEPPRDPNALPPDVLRAQRQEENRIALEKRAEKKTRKKERKLAEEYRLAEEQLQQRIAARPPSQDGQKRVEKKLRKFEAARSQLAKKLRKLERKKEMMKEERAARKPPPILEEWEKKQKSKKVVDEA